ncbi:MAG: hypothetical protein WAQ98_21460 [Blastocatellia bacterium]
MNKLAEIDLKFFQEVMGWNVKTVKQLPSFSVAKGDELGWAILNRELQGCFLVRNFLLDSSYVVILQKQRERGISIGKGETLALAATLALINLNQCKYIGLQEIRHLNQILVKDYQGHLSAMSGCYLVFHHNKILARDLKIAV